MSVALEEVQWRSPEWIQAHGGLRSSNVIDYFSQSPFFDRSSNNSALQMQTQFSDLNIVDLHEKLKTMVGIEFVLAYAKEPELWVIRKQRRYSRDETQLLSVYFVAGENVFMAPDIYSIVRSRLLSSSYALNSALTQALSLPSFSPSEGYSFVNDMSVINDESPAKSVKASQYASPATPASKPTMTYASQSSRDVLDLEKALRASLAD